MDSSETVNFLNFILYYFPKTMDQRGRGRVRRIRSGRRRVNGKRYNPYSREIITENYRKCLRGCRSLSVCRSLFPVVVVVVESTIIISGSLLLCQPACPRSVQPWRYKKITRHATHISRVVESELQSRSPSPMIY